MKIIIDSQDKISSMAASMIAEHAKAKPGCAMAFAAGRTTKKVYDALTAMNIKELAECKAFTVCEYEGLEAGDTRSCAYRLNEELYSKAGITQKSVAALNLPFLVSVQTATSVLTSLQHLMIHIRTPCC